MPAVAEGFDPAIPDGPRNTRNTQKNRIHLRGAYGRKGPHSPRQRRGKAHVRAAIAARKIPARLRQGYGAASVIESTVRRSSCLVLPSVFRVFRRPFSGVSSVARLQARRPVGRVGNGLQPRTHERGHGRNSRGCGRVAALVKAQKGELASRQNPRSHERGHGTAVLEPQAPVARFVSVIAIAMPHPATSRACVRAATTTDRSRLRPPPYCFSSPATIPSMSIDSGWPAWTTLPSRLITYVVGTPVMRNAVTGFAWKPPAPAQ